MRVTTRLFASISSKTAPKNASGTKPTTVKQSAFGQRKDAPLSLEHFIQRQRVLHLYRDVMRRLYSIPASAKQQRDEFIDHARSEFARNKHVKDITQIRYLISVGKADMKGWERMIEELAQSAPR